MFNGKHFFCSVFLAVNMSNIQQIKQAVDFLAGRCDGAREQDGSGFNRFDVGLGMSMAERPIEDWSQQAAYNAYAMLKKYTKQLALGGINYAQIEAPANGFDKSAKRIYAKANQFVITFPYDPALVAIVKALPKRRFDSDGKCWIASAVMENVTALFGFKAHGFEIEQSALDLMAEVDAGTEVESVAQVEPVATKPAAPGSLILTGKRIEVTFKSIPDSDIREWMKGQPGWKYADQKWSFPVDLALKIAQKFPTHDGASDLIAKAHAAQNQAVNAKAEIIAKLKSAVDLSQPMPNGRKAFAHQVEGINRMLECHKLINADDMGLGKTFQALVAAKAWQIAFGYPTIVICPASLRDNWLREAAGVEVGIEVYSWAKMPEAPNKPFVLIADEAHFMQSGKRSARGKAGLELAGDDNCKAAYMLTGTPMKNGRPANLYPLLKAVEADIAKDKKGYEKRYCNAGPTRFNPWDTTGASHLDELHVKCKPFMLRRLKKDCLDLPGKLRTMRAADLSTEAQREYNRALKEMRDEYKRRIAEGEISSEGEALVMLTHLRRAGSIAKAETAIELAEEILESGQSVVLFTEFVESAQAIKAAFASYGAELLTGDVTGKDADSETSKRQAMVDRFQAGKSKVFVSTIRAGGVGITLTASSNVILVDRPWTPGDAEQAEDRCYRIGQTEMVNIQWIQCGEIDAKVDAILLEKSQRIELVLEGDRKTMRGTKSVAQQMMLALKEICK